MTIFNINLKKKSNIKFLVTSWHFVRSCNESPFNKWTPTFYTYFWTDQAPACKQCPEGSYRTWNIQALFEGLHLYKETFPSFSCS